MKAGPSREVRKVWEEHAGPLRRFIARRVKDPHDTEDVLQEVFLKAHAALAGGRRPGLLKPWLYRVAENVVADYYRKRFRAAETSLHAAEQDEPAAEAAEPENLNADVVSCLRPMIEKLPEGYRRALVLADLEGKKGREVAGELGLSVPGAKSRVQRARRKLKATLLSCCRLELDRVGNVLECERKEKARSCFC